MMMASRHLGTNMRGGEFGEFGSLKGCRGASVAWSILASQYKALKIV